jgi:adenylate kinase
MIERPVASEQSGRDESSRFTRTASDAIRLLIIGPPGAGKGTQSLPLARELTIPHISTGDLLREAIRIATPLGRSVDNCVTSGRLVPDALVNELVRVRLEEPDARESGFLLDGFPRNLDQLDALLRWLSPDGLDAAIELAVPNAVVANRLAARGRADDTSPSIGERFDAFEHETSPLLHRLDRQGLLISIDADRPIDDVTEELLGVLRTPHRRVLASSRP